MKGEKKTGMRTKEHWQEMRPLQLPRTERRQLFNVPQQFACTGEKGQKGFCVAGSVSSAIPGLAQHPQLLESADPAGRMPECSQLTAVCSLCKQQVDKWLSQLQASRSFSSHRGIHRHTPAVTDPLVCLSSFQARPWAWNTKMDKPKSPVSRSPQAGEGDKPEGSTSDEVVDQEKSCTKYLLFGIKG